MDRKLKVLFKNGKIYTGPSPREEAAGESLKETFKEAFVVEGGKFTFVGTNSQSEELICHEKFDAVVDLNGRFVCGGFNDSHMHLVNYGLSLSMASLNEHTGSLEEVIEEMKRFAATGLKRGGLWIGGRGWNQDYFTDVNRMPSRYDLDNVSRSYPVIITRCCGHCLVVNSKALELCGVNEETATPEGGRIGMEEGRLDGRFYDAAMDLIYDHLPTPTKEEIKDMIRLACKALNSYGITSSQTDDYEAFNKVSWRTINEAYKELEESGELTVKVYQQCNFKTLPELKEFVEAGCVSGEVSAGGAALSGQDTDESLYKIGPLKLLGDGSLGARTAYLRDPYSDDPSTSGIPIFTREQMEELVAYASSHGMSVAIHTIGDKTMDFALNAIEKALVKAGQEASGTYRHGVVHCQITGDDQLKRLGDMKLHIYAQTIFLDYDINIVENLVGPERAATSYSWKTLMKKGCTVSNGSDCPVELPDVMAGIQCAVTRKNLDGTKGPYLPQEAFTVKEALDSYTYNGAIASFEEDSKGLIAPGYAADFVVLGQDPFEAEASSIKDISIEETYLNGNRVF